MKRLAFLLVAATLCAAVIHIIAILAVPQFARDDAWSRSKAIGGAFQTHFLGDQKQALEIFPGLDPQFAYGLCRVSVAEAPAHLHGSLGNRFWSVSYLDPRGRHQYGLTNQISGSELDVVLATKGQQRLISEQPDLVKDTTVTITAKGEEGFLFLRLFVGQKGERQTSEAAIKALDCEPLWSISSGGEAQG